MPDHMHLLASLNRQTSVADALRVIKANSSRWVHETFPALGGFAWQAGYGAFTVSYSHLPNVKAYLARHAEHHRTTTFQEEFLAFLKGTTSRTTSGICGIDLGLHRPSPFRTPTPGARASCDFDRVPSGAVVPTGHVFNAAG
jgi:hypothetical protein